MVSGPGGTILVFVSVQEHATNELTSLSGPGRINAPGFLMPSLVARMSGSDIRGRPAYRFAHAGYALCGCILRRCEIAETKPPKRHGLEKRSHRGHLTDARMLHRC